VQAVRRGDVPTAESSTQVVTTLSALRAGPEHARQVLRQISAVAHPPRGPGRFRSAYLQPVADPNQNPK
jgi:hypothetical protein